MNIGHSCNLLQEDTKLFTLTQAEGVTGDESFGKQLKQVHHDLIIGLAMGQKWPSVALVLDGFAFKFYQEENAEQRLRLLQIGKYCRSVIGCRLSPTQKQQLVRLVKKYSSPRSVTLAIGDGANDVSMIREADVGVGIVGKEGRQAANSADFAIGEFRFLKRLLLVHGRWNYIRQSKAFLYCMHKNMVITLTLFCYNFFAMVSGQTLFQSYVYTGFNFFLGLPIVAYGIMDKDISDDYAMNHPECYATGRLNEMLSPWAIGLWAINAMILSSLICLLYFLALHDSYSSEGIFEIGTAIFISLILGLQMKIAFLYHQWNYITVIVMILSLLMLYIWLFIVDSAEEIFPDFYNTAKYTLSSSLNWLFSSFTFPVIFWLVGNIIILSL